MESRLSLRQWPWGNPSSARGRSGQVDVIQDGVTGVYVPVGDPVALREAMLSLWNDPHRAHTMGARARAYVEEHHTLDQFAVNVRTAAEASLEGRPAPNSWWTGEASAIARA